MLLTVTASPPATYIHPGRADVIQHWNMSWCSPSYFLFALLTLKYDLPSFCLLSHTLSLLNFLSWRTHIKQNSALLLHAYGSASIYLGTRIRTCCLAETDGQEVPFCPFQSIASHRDIHGSDFHHHRLVLPILCFGILECAPLASFVQHIQSILKIQGSPPPGSLPCCMNLHFRPHPGLINLFPHTPQQSSTTLLVNCKPREGRHLWGSPHCLQNTVWQVTGTQ